MKPHYLMTKQECLDELTSGGHQIKNAKEYSLPEVRVLVREARVHTGLTPDKESEEQDFLRQVNKANLAELRDMCTKRGISLPAKPRVGEMRLELKSWALNTGTGETVYKLGGRCNGMTFQEIALSDPEYLNWAKSEVQKKDNSHWQLRQLALWAEKMDKDEMSTTPREPKTIQEALTMKNTPDKKSGYPTEPEQPPPVTPPPMKTQGLPSSPEMAEMTEVMRSLAMTVGTLQRNVEELQQEKSRKTRSSASRSTEGFEKVEHLADAQ